MKYGSLRMKDYYSFLGEEGLDPVLQMYIPDNLTEMDRDAQKHPVILICPGGGYMFCSQRESEPIALHFLPEGYNVFVLHYSTGGAKYPTQMIEVAAALDLIYHNAEAWHCDVSHIALMGFSAGGHLAASYANAYDCDEVRVVFPESKPVQASVLCYPVISADPMWTHAGSIHALTGKKQCTADEIERFSCDKHISDTTPPTFLWHTTVDTTVPVMNSLLYAKALATSQVPFELHIYPTGIHGLATADAQTLDIGRNDREYASDWLPAVKKWLRTTL